MKIRTMAASAALAIASVVGFHATPAFAACNVNVELHNRDTVDSTVDWSGSKVKIQGGWWNVIGSSSDTILAGDTNYYVVHTGFNCGADRRWQFEFHQGGNVQVIYEPSSTGWTNSQTIHIDTNFP
ncbi:MAG TPA: hypothetical protein VKB57_26595 [Acidimicrobiales bacterium]|nr:hypothetical protein [Acidimicrobiales bacterium]